MPKGVYARKTTEELFWEKVAVKSDDECWLWTASVYPDGYGSFTVSGKTCQAHRYSGILKFKEITKGQMVRHTCDTRACVNPAHLILGTAKDNSADMVERNRQARGEKQHQAILTDAQALEVLRKYKVAVDTNKTYGVLVALAEEYHSSKQTIYRITSRQTYTHLDI